MARAQLGELDLHYVERGSGPPLLLVPGIPAVASDWAPLAERLSGSRRVIAYDNRGNQLVLGCTHCGLEHAARPERDAGRAFAMATDDWAERMAALAPFAFADGVDGELLSRFVEKKAADVQDPEGYRGQIAAALAHDSYDRLPQIACPTLILTGDGDRVIPGASSDVLHERMPGSRLEVSAGAGHLFFIEQPEESLRLLEQFLR